MLFCPVAMDVIRIYWFNADLFFTLILVAPKFGQSTHISWHCEALDLTSGRDYGYLTCDNEWNAPSLCERACTDPSYHQPFFKAEMNQCQVWWDISSPTGIASAKWFGQASYCYHFHCEMPEDLEYDLPYTCSSEPQNFMGGSSGGYLEDDECSFTCPTSQQVVLKCIQKLPEDFNRAKFIFGRGIWKVKSKPCAVGYCADLATLLSAGVKRDCTYENEFLSVCTFECQEFDHILSHYDPLECIAPDGVFEWDHDVPTCSKSADPHCSPIIFDPDAGMRKLQCDGTYFVGHKCNLYCKEGYGTAFSYEATCEWNAAHTAVQWNSLYAGPNVELRCTEIRCLDPAYFPTGILVSCTDEEDRGKLGNTCIFKCALGLKAEGDDDMTIMKCIGNPTNFGTASGIFVATQYPCEPIYCPEMSTLIVDSVMTFDCTKGTEYHSNCSFTCPVGKVPTDLTHFSVCEDENKVAVWRPPPPGACEDVLCPSLDPEADGGHGGLTMVCTNDNFFGSHCFFTCPTDRKFSDPDKVASTCKDNNHDGVGEWDPDVTTMSECSRIECVMFTSGSPEVIVSCTDSSYLNSVCSFTCPDGMRLNSGEPTKCHDPDGDQDPEWSIDMRKNVYFCDPITCPEIDASSLAADISISCSDSNMFQSNCTFGCPKGKKLEAGDIEATTCQDVDGDLYGEWSPKFTGSDPSCTAVICPVLDPSGLSVGVAAECTDTHMFSSVCTFDCPVGQKLSEDSPETTTCKDDDDDKEGAWDPDYLAMPPNCTAVTCPTIEQSSLPPFLLMSCSDANNWRSTCTFSCPKGKKFGETGQESVQCKDEDKDLNGEWNADLSTAIPSCVDVVCPTIDETTLSAGTNVACNNTNIYHSQCTYTCDEGYILNAGVNTILCSDPNNDEVGEWDRTDLNCTLITCELDTSFLVNTVVSCTDEGNYGSVCSFTCPEGMKLNTDVTSTTCQDTDNDGVGKWLDDFPDCGDVKCPRLDTSETSPETSHTCTKADLMNSVCTFECPEGMQVPGGKTEITCDDSDGDGVGEWSGASPSCYYPECDEIVRSMVNDETYFTCGKWKCTFSCKKGTTLSGAESVLKCEDPEGDGTGEWSAPVPLCNTINCTEIVPADLHPEAEFTCTRAHHIDSKCDFSCPSGKKLTTDHKSVTCDDADDDGVGKWTPKGVPDCEQIHCEELVWSRISDYLTIDCTDENRWGSVCTFRCTLGQWMDGPDLSMTCGDDDSEGKWDVPIPACETIVCLPKYSMLVEGEVTCNDTNKYNSYCTYMCYEGFYLEGTPAFCNDFDDDGVGDWNASFPSCEEIIIPPDCIVYPVPPGTIQDCTNEAYVGSICSYRCEENYVMFGSDEDIECLSKGNDTFEWSGMFPTCQIPQGSCSPKMSAPVYGDFSCTGEAYVSSVCTFTCDEEYHIVGSETVTCEDFDLDKVGEWSDEAPICFPDVVRCEPMFEPLENGKLTCTNENIKLSVCRFTCDSGYDLAGEDSIQCTDENNDGVGVWQSRTPTCEVVKCDDIDASELSRETTFNCTDEYNGNSKCTFYCPDHMRLERGYNEITCEDRDSNAEGKWSHEAPTCIDIACLFNEYALSPKTTFSCTNEYKLDSTCSFSCPVGMKLTTPHSEITCSDPDGDKFAEWDKDKPDCIPIVCPDIQDDSFSDETSYSCTNLNRMMSVCTFLCPIGFKLHNGISRVECEDLDNNGEGEWSEEFPTCIPIVCKEIDPDTLSPHTILSCTNGNLGNSVCSLSCPANMRLTIPGEVSDHTCVDSNGDGEGEWDVPSIPDCVYTCSPPLKDPENGRYMCTNLNRLGSTCQYDCNAGYFLSHVKLTECVMAPSGTKGEWKGDTPNCDVLSFTCPDLTKAKFTPETKFSCTDKNNMGSKCKFTCPEEMVLSKSHKVVICVDKDKNGIGEWNRSPPECYRTACPFGHMELEFGEAVCTAGNDIGSSCTIECDSGFEAVPPYAMVCQKTGHWNSSAPICTASKCYPPLKGLFGPDATCYDDNNPGSECDVKCSHRSQKYKQKLTFACAKPTEYNGAGFWNEDLVSCAGCGLGFVDLLFMLDGSVNLEKWYFSDMREWITSVVKELTPSITVGATWISATVFGGRHKSCEMGYSSPGFKIGLKLNYHHLEDIKRSLLKLRHMGGCSHMGTGLQRSLEHITTRKRPFFTPIIVLMIGGAPHEDVRDALAEANHSDVHLFGVGFGNASKTFLEKNYIRTFPVSTSDELSEITKPFSKAAVKLDCMGRSRCSGPIENGTVACSILKLKPPTESCKVHCDVGHQLIGNDTVLCGDLNADDLLEWLSPLGECVRITCPLIESSKNLSAYCTNKNNFASVCSIRCLNGMFLVGFSQMVCGDPDGDGVGEWNARQPLCLSSLNCLPVFTAPNLGTVNCTMGNTYGSACRFECDVGFVLEGSGVVQCSDARSRGLVEWDNEPPTCKGCDGSYCYRDIMLVIDGSGSISSSDFVEAKNWLIEIISAFKGNIDTGSTWIGIIQYSGKSAFLCTSGALNPRYAVELEIGKYLFREVTHKIGGIGRLRGCTATGDALKRALDHLEVLGRPNVVKVIMLITDGWSNDDVTEPANEAQEKDVRIIPIAIGSFDPTQLKQISGRVIEVGNYEDLKSVVDIVQQEIENDLSDLDFHFGGGTIVDLSWHVLTGCAAFCLLLSMQMKGL